MTPTRPPTLKPNGTRFIYERDPSGRVVGLKKIDLTGNTLAEENYEYDFGNNLAWIKKWLWTDDYSKTGSYTFLGEDKSAKQVRIGFLSVKPPHGCLEITEPEELLKIDAHRRATNHMPFVTEDKKYGK